MGEPTIRVNGALLPQFVNARVRVVGTVTDASDTVITLNAPDNQPIQVCNPRSQYERNSIVEVIGKAISGHQIEEDVSYRLDNLNLDMYNQMLEAYHKNHEIFY